MKMCPSYYWPKFGPAKNSWLENHFVILGKTIEWVAFQLSLSYWFVLIESVCGQYFCGVMERFDSQPKQFMLSTVISFKLMIEVLVK